VFKEEDLGVQKHASIHVLFVVCLGLYVSLVQFQGSHTWIVRVSQINIIEWNDFVVQSCRLSESRDCLEDDVS